MKHSQIFYGVILKMIGKTISHYRIMEELPGCAGTSGRGGNVSRKALSEIDV